MFMTAMNVRSHRTQDYVQNYSTDCDSAKFIKNCGTKARQTKHPPLEVEAVGLGPTWVPSEPGCSTFLLSQNTVFLSGICKCLGLQTLCEICWQKGVFLVCEVKDSTEETVRTVRPYLLKCPGPGFSLFQRHSPCPFSPLQRCLRQLL